jgi:hypothetical protein
MASPVQRRSNRVSLTLLLEATGTDSQGRDFREPSRTLLISRSGALIALNRTLKPTQRIHIQRRAPNESHRHAEARVVGKFGEYEDGHLYGVELLDPDVDIWGVEFPAPTGESMACMLLECSYCHAREVAYLNELELRGFEINRGVARPCKVCGVPSIWIQAAHEVEKKLRSPRSRRTPDAVKPALPAGEQRDRQRMRLKTRLTACVRQPGAEEELAVCEDISPIGMCFRSKRRFDVNSTIDVAVPYSPEAANVFRAARIAYSEEIPKAGLFRHGTEYQK